VRGRNSDETENLMGYFTNTLPLRARIDPSLPFADALREVKSVLLDSFANPDIRLEDLMSELAVRSASGGGQVLYHAMFSFQDVRQRNLQWGNIQHSRIELADPGATQDLGLWLVENGGGLAGAVVYNSDTLLESTAAMLAERFRAMLESLVRDPTQTIAQLTRFDDGRPALMGREHAAEAPALAADAAASAAQEAAPAALADDDPLVAQVAGLWAELLGRDRVGIDEDFFALGGHSLQAVRMFHRLGKATRVNLPLATLFAAPTARSLAAAYRAAGATVPGESPAAATADPWAPLVPIRAGADPGAPALFFAHAIGGNVLNYRTLAASLPEGMAIYGLQARGLDGVTPPLERIEEMARRYVAEVRKVQPSGPYYLAGGSMGGMIAYEMAQQLTAAGEGVALLGMIDTSSHYGRRLREQAAHPPSAWSRLRARLRGLSPGTALAALVRMPGNRIAAARSRRLVAELRRRGEPLPHELRYAHVEAMHLRAYRDYVVQPWPGRLTLFRAAQQDPELGDDPCLGWSAFAGEVEVFDVPGTHRGIVEKPELPPKLAEAIDAARRRVTHARDRIGMEAGAGLAAQEA
jgi:thioesterase domain-containing protein